jgi:hypothetical protein
MASTSSRSIPSLASIGTVSSWIKVGLQSVGRLDGLRKALGLAPGVDPIGTCRSLGVTKEPKPQGKNTGERGTNENEENRKTASNGGEN